MTNPSCATPRRPPPLEGPLARVLDEDGDLLRQFVRTLFYAGFPLEVSRGAVVLAPALGEAGQERFRSAMASASMARLARDMVAGPEKVAKILASWSHGKHRDSLERMLIGPWSDPRTGPERTRVATGAAAMASALVSVGCILQPFDRRRRQRSVRIGPSSVRVPIARESADWCAAVVGFAQAGLHRHQELELDVAMVDGELEVLISEGSHTTEITLPVAEAILANRRALLSARAQADLGAGVPWMLAAEPPVEFTNQSIEDLFAPRPATGWNDDPFPWAVEPSGTAR